jgi:DNA-directed RNA polymerase specialized sigma24 family protein
MTNQSNDDLSNLYERCRDVMVSYASKYHWLDIESLVNDSFLAAHQKGVSSEPFVWGIFKHKLKSAFRSDVRNKSKLDRFKTHCEIHSQNSGEIEHDFSKLKMNDQEKHLLSLLINQTNRDDIADILNIKRNAVDVRVHRLRRKLKDQLNG